MNAIAPRPTSTNVISAIQITSFGELMRFAEMAAPSDLMPKDYWGRPGNIVIAVQLGSELGLSPMQSLSNISVINGRASVWGDAMLGLVRNSPKCQDVIESITGEGDARTATCTVKRQGSSDTVRTFSVGDAKKAGLWGKQGPWQQYPDRMLQMRARGFSCRDAFPDVLRGLISAEEATDMPKDDFRGTTVDHTPDPVPSRPTAAAAEPVVVQPTMLEKVQARLDACKTLAHVDNTEALASVQKALHEAPDAIVRQIHGMISAARQRVEPAAVAAAGEHHTWADENDGVMPD